MVFRVCEVLALRPLTDAERAGLRSPAASTLRRCRYPLAGAEGRTAAAIAPAYGSFQ